LGAPFSSEALNDYANNHDLDELTQRGIQATFRTRPLKDYAKRDAWVFFVVAEALAITH